jgi:single stranded DNA-binding protein
MENNYQGLSGPSDLNNFTMTGRLTRDSTYKVMGSGKGVCNFSVANNTGFGQYRSTNFFKVAIFGIIADKLHEYLVKGKEVTIVGAMESNDWQNSEGQTIKDYIIKASFIKLGRGGQQDNQRAPNPSYSYDDGDAVF